MDKAYVKIPQPYNEPVLSYAPGTPEREEVLKTYREMWNSHVEVPLYIDGEPVYTGDTKPIRPPHDHRHVVGVYHRASQDHVRQAIDAALKARQQWADLPWEQRISIFLKAADLISGPYRAKMNAATMINQSKTIHQAEIDAVAELADFWRFNAEYLRRIYTEQPDSAKGVFNRMEYRPLEGFVYAVTPFNFTSIAGNLPTAPAMAGNVVIWKPSVSQMYSANMIMEVLREAGLPPGVINMVSGNAQKITEVVLAHPDFAGLHYTGSTAVFQYLWKTIGQNIDKYKSYPRIVGETGGKDFVWMHASADPREVATALSRGAFEYQGQKCSAASRAYIPKSKWDEVFAILKEQVESMKMGAPDDFSNFITAVISESSFNKLAGYIEKAKRDPEVEIVLGGGYDKSKGYFIEPTVFLTTDPYYETMVEELFGPILTVYLYDDDQWKESLDLVDNTSPYGLTGAIFAKDRYVIDYATKRLENAAGNFYINDKPTGAIVNQQPFGGARASGTNDKAGSMWNLIRWISPRAIKENFNPPKDYRYPYMGE
ncbi:MAG: L-glutamate gamma-semialdehyde dehydrogenase [Chlorobi bacterium]|nr:L-glutamate gamma-semialdehyde dehydrogenase [Chlorobiota bacterium]